MPENVTDACQRKETARPGWKTDLLRGNWRKVKTLVGEEVFKPDDPVDENGRSPLIDLALQKPLDEGHIHSLAFTAHILLEAGAVLNLKDYKGLYPADYALISPNCFLAQKILLSTVHNFSRTTYAGKPYRPALEALFAVMPGDTQRNDAYENLLINTFAFGKTLHRAIEDHDGKLAPLPKNEVLFWQSYSPPQLETLPDPSGLTILFENVTTFQRERDMARDQGDREMDEIFDNEELNLRFMQWLRTKDLPRPGP